MQRDAQLTEESPDDNSSGTSAPDTGDASDESTVTAKPPDMPPGAAPEVHPSGTTSPSPSPPLISASNAAPAANLSSTHPWFHKRWELPILAATAAFSLFAVAVSLGSLYETVLKPAKPALYVSSILRVGGVDLQQQRILLPLTIVNHGSRDAVVTNVTLTARSTSGDSATFISSHVGENLNKPDRSFTPIPVAGHGAFSDSVIFSPEADGGETKPGLIASGSPGVIFSAAGDYCFCLSMRTEAVDFPAFFYWFNRFAPMNIEFAATLKPFEAQQLGSGKAVEMRIVGFGLGVSVGAAGRSITENCK